MRLAHPLALLLPAVFFLYLLGMVYTENRLAGWQNVETKLSLLVFPLVLIGTPPERLQPRQWLRAFVAGCMVAVIFSLCSALWVYFSTGVPNFSYTRLGSFLSLHPTYFSLYIILAIFGVILEKDFTTWQKVALTGMLLLFFFLLSARMQILLLGILALGALWVWAIRRHTIKTASLATAGSLVLFLIPLLLLPTTRFRFQRLLHPTDNVRVQTWEATSTLIAQHPLLGTGTGDFMEELYETYRSKAYLNALKDKLNAHNQYLQTAATIGIPASLFWILCLGWPLVLAWKEKRSLFLWFLILFALSNLTESMLETQRGTMFYGFFNSLFLAEILKEKTTGFFFGTD